MTGKEAAKGNQLRNLLIVVVILLAVIAAGIIVLLVSPRRGGVAIAVESFTPVGEIPQATNFTIEFSKEVVGDSLVGVTLDEAPVVFKPVIPGVFKWIARNKLRFFPDVVLLPSSEYSAEILPDIITREQAYLTGKRKFTFYTRRFGVEAASVALVFGPDVKKQVIVSGEIGFNYSVDLEEVKKYLTVIFKDGGAIPVELTTGTNDKRAVFESQPMERWENARTVVVFINRRLRAREGNLGLYGDYERTFSLGLGGELKIESVTPAQRGIYGSFRIRFSSPVAAEEAEQYVWIEPDIKHELVGEHTEIEIRGDFPAGTTYTITVRPGLMAINGAILKDEFSTRVTLKDLEPSIDFVGEGVYLSREGRLNVGLATINVEEVLLEIQKVYANNLVYLLNTDNLTRYYHESYYGGYRLRALGTEVLRDTMEIMPLRNQEVVTPISLEKYLKDERIGIFSIGAYRPEERWDSAHRWVMITDLGIMAKMAGDELYVWVNSLSSLEAVRDAKVNVISRNNQTLLEGRTDSEGLVVFRGVKAAIAGFEPFVVMASRGKDLSFIELDQSRISTGDFDIGGTPYLRDGYTAFLYTERGVYRPGEKAHLVAVVREAGMLVPPSFPLRVEIWGPDNRILHELKRSTDGQGSCEYEVELPVYVRTGRYVAKAFVGKENEIGRTAFNVEEFIPDRIKVKIETDSLSYMLKRTIDVRVEAVNLFGPPAKGRRAEMSLVIESSRFAPPQWKSFTFNDPDKTFSKQEIASGEVYLDDQGKYTFNITLPSYIDASSGLTGRATVTVFEPGGRGVTAEHLLALHPYSHYVGLRRAKEGYAAVDEPVAYEFIVVDTRGEAAPGRNCEVSVFEVIYQSVLQRTGSRGYRYVSERQDKLIDSFKAVSGEKPEPFKVVAKHYGRYKVVVRDVGSGSTSSTYFYASGWGYVPWAMDRPERLELGFDKDSYRVGETARIQVRAPFPGKLILTVERDNLLKHRVLVMQENTATIDLPVTEAYKPNVYVSASVIRSTRSLERHAPVRAFGVVPLFVDCSENRPSIEVDAPDEMRPEAPLKVSFTVKGGYGSHRVTVAAVDEGILQLTDFATPNPFGFFFSKKLLEVESYDLYSLVLPEIEPAVSRKSPSGGLPEEERKKRLIPITVARVKPVSLWSGLVETDAQGRGSVTLDVPQFNGTLRVMVVSFSGKRFNGVSKDVIVRDAIVLTPTYPRFVSSNDEFMVPVSVYNGAGGHDNFKVTLDVDGPVRKPERATQTISLRPGEEGQVAYALKAMEGLGKITFALSAEGAGEQTEMTTEVPLRPPSPPLTLTGSGAVKAGEEATFELPSTLLEGTTQFDVVISGFPAVRFAGSLQYLLSYPHGCAEQTTSKVFPLLYFNDIAKEVEPDIFGTKAPDYFVNEGIRKLENMQLANGRFSFWPRGTNWYGWTSVYVAHFLVEARKAGYEVSERVYRNMIAGLEKELREPLTDRWEREIRAYSCYVLAAAGKADRSAMLYLKNNELDNLSDYSYFQLAGAFALSGDMKTALSLLPNTVEPQETKRESGRNFNSSTRALAIMLDVLAEIKPDHPAVPGLVEKLTQTVSKHGRWYNTQDNAFAFMALGKILRKQTESNYSGQLLVDGVPYADFDDEDHRFREKDWGGKSITIKTQGTGTCYYYWKAFGIPKDPNVPEYDRELVVRRVYFTDKGDAIEDRIFHQGDLIVAGITCEALTEDLDNVIVTDLLPAGLEIENPRLESRAGVDWIAQKYVQPDYLDIRDDRMIFSTGLVRRREMTFYYALRVVTEGKFALPQISAEAMYDPEKSSVASGGTIEVRK